MLPKYESRQDPVAVERAVRRLLDALERMNHRELLSLNVTDARDALRLMYPKPKHGTAPRDRALSLKP